MPPEKSARRLGRGLDALFNAPVEQAAPSREEGPLRDLDIADISRNPFQPRITFKPEELRELQESLSANGLLQPITVRKTPNGSGFQLIAGERRLRAATNLGWKKIQAVVRDLSDREVLTLALVENLQRSDLNPVEEAKGYDRLIREFEHTQQTVAEMVGKDRSTVANVLRILHLPDAVRELIEQGKLSAGQARPLLGLDDASRITLFAKQAVQEGWSAREVERRVREVDRPAAAAKRGRPRKTDERPAEIRSLEQKLRKYFQTDVSIDLKSNSKGAVSIAFYSADDLERLIEILGVPDSSD
jgi:ParB family chromosome partitioning protein